MAGTKRDARLEIQPLSEAAAIALGAKIGSQLGVLLLDKQEASVNTFDSRMVDDVNVALDRLEGLVGEGKVGAVVVASAKGNSFCHGANLVEVLTLPDFDKFVELSTKGQKTFSRLENLPIPTVAIVNSTCLGGGLEFALSCDYRIVGPGAVMGLPETTIGLLPGWGGCVRLPRLVGLLPSLEMICSGKTVKGKRAKGLGLADAMVDGSQDFLTPGGLGGIATKLWEGRKMTEHLGMAKFGFKWVGNTFLDMELLYAGTAHMLDKVTKRKFPAPYVALRVVMQAWQCADYQEAFMIEARGIAECGTTTECKNLLHLFNAGKAVKAHSTNYGGEKEIGKDIKHVIVVGAGLTGRGIGYAMLKAGLSVYLIDQSADTLYEADKVIGGLLEKDAKKGGEKVDMVRARFQKGTSFEAFSLANIGPDDWLLVLEAAPESVEVKAEILKSAEKVMQERGLSGRVLYGTSTSSLPLESITGGFSRPDLVVGIHFLLPVPSSKVVEVVVGPKTSVQSVHTAAKLVGVLKRMAIICKDKTPGFVVQRGLGALFLSAVRLWLLGYGTIESIDKMAASEGLKRPFATMDEIGMDTLYLAGSNVLKAQAPASINIMAIVRSLADKGHKGVSNGKGFYLYKGKQRTKVNPFLHSAEFAEVRKKIIGEMVTKKNKFSWGQARQLLLLPIINQCVQVVDEGIVEGPEEVDVAMVQGIGFPPHLGGPIQCVDRLGAKTVASQLEVLANTYGFADLQPATSLKDGRVFYPKNHPNMPPPKGVQSFSWLVPTTSRTILQTVILVGVLSAFGIFVVPVWRWQWLWQP